MYDEDSTNVAMEISPKGEQLLQRYQRNLQQAREEVVRLEKLTLLLKTNPETAEILTLMKGGR